MGAAGMAGPAGGYAGGFAGPAGGYAGGARGPAGNGCAVGVGPGEDCTACGVGCGGGGNNGLSYVGGGQGEYVQECNYKYIGAGGDFDVARPRRDFTCLITTCGLLSLLLLIPLLLWLCSVFTTTSGGVDCDAGFMMWESAWSREKQDYCCSMLGRGCAISTSASLVTFPPQPPPTPFPSTMGPTTSVWVDPNCAVGEQNTWSQVKKEWCCKNHHVGCAPSVVLPTLPPRAADPYNCNDGFANWQAGWAVGKKAWCCRVHGKGCPNQAGGGCVTGPVVQPSFPVAPGLPVALPYDCDAGFANWVIGWSVAKKAWCCINAHKGCPLTQPFDCAAGFANWQAGWAPEKKTWCCQNEQRGCMR